MFENPWGKAPRSIHEQVPHVEERRAKHHDRLLCASRMLNLEVFTFQELRSGLALLFSRSVSIISNMIDMLLLEKILLITFGCVGLEIRGSRQGARGFGRCVYFCLLCCEIKRSIPAARVHVDYAVEKSVSFCSVQT